MIPLYDPKPEIAAQRAEFDARLAGVLDTGSFILGPEVTEFETAMADFIGVEHCIGVNSGTDALIIGLRAAGVQPGDEVITSSFTFFATGEAIDLIGATPVFVDVDPFSMNLDPAMVRQAITSKTTAIVPVHIFGRPAEMTAITAIADANDLIVLEDCAQSFGAASEARLTGSMGHAGAFSFFPSKNLGGFGDGGAITTDDPAIAEEAIRLRNHGSIKRYENEVFGYNSRLDSLQAAILNVKLPYLQSNNERRRTIAAAYNDAFGDLPGIIVPAFPERDRHVFGQYTMRVLDARRERLAEAVNQRGVSTAVYYPTPLHMLPVYRDRKHGPLTVTEQLATEVLSVPMFPGMTDDQLEAVIEAVLESAMAISNND